MRIIAQPAFTNRDSNPYTWLLYTHVREHGVEVDEYSGARLLSGGHDVWHLHWPEVRLNHASSAAALWRIIRLRYLLDRARRSGIRVVWTVHNLRAHERLHPRLEGLLWSTLIPRIDAYISPSEAGRAAAIERFPALARLPGYVIPIGHYRDVHPNTVSRAEARLRLGLEQQATVAAYVGLIRPYKNVPRLLTAFRQLDDAEARLLVQGRVVWPESETAVRGAAGSDPRIRLDLCFVPDDELQLYLNAADLVVLPFRDILHSASALLALSFDRPVLVPEAGAIPELQRLVGDEWVRTYPGELTAGHLAVALAWARQRPPRSCDALDALNWRRVAADTVAAYREIRDSAPRPRP